MAAPAMARVDRSVVFAEWRQCKLPYNTGFLGPPQFAHKRRSALL